MNLRAVLSCALLPYNCTCLPTARAPPWLVCLCAVLALPAVN